MNELDTELMVGILQQRGMERSDDPAVADLLIYNSCSVRDLAERKALGTVGKMTSRLASGGEAPPVIGIAGCMANAKKEELLKKLPRVDFVVGTNNIHDLDAILDDVVATGQPIVKADRHFTHELNYLAAVRDNPVKAYVSIIRGCDKFCTYCVVPYTRGKEVSRDPDSIVEECQLLAEKGYREITLLGQNVNSYGKDQAGWGCRFHDLLYRLDQIPGIARIRFMTSHPVDITRELMEAIRDLPSVCEFVHFPIQAGSDRILRKMHRIYTKEEYLEKVSLLRALVPTATLGTDIIVGFPTESEEEFEMTYEVMKEIRYSVAFIFAYSARKGTPAKRWPDDVPEEVKQERLQRLLHLQEEIYLEEQQRMLGTVEEVLVEGVSSKNSHLVKGRTRGWKSVLLPGDSSMIGTLQQVEIHSFNHHTLLGKGAEKQSCEEDKRHLA